MKRKTYRIRNRGGNPNNPRGQKRLRQPVKPQHKPIHPTTLFRAYVPFSRMMAIGQQLKDCFGCHTVLAKELTPHKPNWYRIEGIRDPHVNPSLCQGVIA